MSQIRYVFIADDDSHKLDDMKGAAKRLFPGAAVQAYTCANGLLYELCWKQAEDVRREPGAYLVLTDMCMPYLDGDQVRPDAGHHVLLELGRRRMACPSVIISSGDVDDDAAREHSQHYVGSVAYDPSVSLYHQLRRLLEGAGILQTERGDDNG